jgi:NADH:ubiquinone oxidoreductase subunit 5 (subunit L)/multisubunit Na+/H+ antiporter MnhA subunit
LGVPVAVGVVALTAGLAAATFVKLIGTGLLALPRSEGAERASESSVPMLAGMTILASGCIALGVFPSVVAGALDRAVRTTGAPVDPLHSSTSRFALAGISGTIAPVVVAGALFVGMLVVVAAARALGGDRRRRRAENWGCGRVVQTARMEYTATSFAEPLQRVFDDVLHPEHDIDVTHVAESRWYLDTVSYRVRVADAIDARVYRPIVRAVRAFGERARAVQNGSMHRYLAYGFVGLLVVLAVAR